MRLLKARKYFGLNPEFYRAKRGETLHKPDDVRFWITLQAAVGLAPLR